MTLPPERLAACLASDVLQLIVMPTEACNFRCTYCYEDFAVGRMRPAVVRGLLRLLDVRVPELARLTVSWFGGEPLLARDVILEVMRHARGLRERHPRLALSSDVTTNAWLLERELFEELLELSVARYQVSFDGPPDVHDAKRVQAGGGPTFERVWSNLAALRDVPGEFTVLVRLHADRENAERLPEFLDRFAATFGGDGRFQVLLKPLGRYGGPNDASLPILTGALQERVLGGLTEALASRGLTAAEGPGDDPICYASRANSLVVRADGRVGKCTVALKHPANTVGRLNEDGTLELDRDRMLGWMRGLRSGDKGELHCPMIGLADPATAAATASV